jgi:hypothetical protein
VSTGCGTPSRLYPLVLVLGLALGLAPAACTTVKNAAMPMVRVEAEKDLQCDGAFVEVEPLLGGRYRAEGCGRVSMYNTVCEGLLCEVAREGEEPPAWRGRPDPGSADERTR